jgi:hypothetical protein
VNSEGRELFIKNKNKYTLEEEDNNDKEIENFQRQNNVRKERIKMRANEYAGH